jgi:hypothetical protein
VPISIRKADGVYTAQVTPRHGDRPWAPERPLSAKELVDALRGLGCHTTDIGDAFYEANPDWLEEVS